MKATPIRVHPVLGTSEVAITAVHYQARQNAAPSRVNCPEYERRSLREKKKHSVSLPEIDNGAPAG